METTKRLIGKQSLGKLYNELMSQGKVYAPVKNTDGKVEYRYNPEFKDVVSDHIRSALSVKNLVFPKVENLFSFTNSKNASSITPVDLSKITSIVLWGVHPCDTAAFDSLRSIFTRDIDDRFFSTRLEKLLVIGFGCSRSDEYCFCTSVGLAPDSSNGSDILLSECKGGVYLAEFITEKGLKMLESYSAFFEQGTETPVIAQVKEKFDYKKVTEKLSGAFEHPFWIENSLRCLGCGACAFVCPTCACFDIQDETRGKNGVRYRSWDSCSFGLFTLHTSGHNPRHAQSQRWRQRIMHKFSYMPERNETPGCVGCGRCSSACPVDMNISEQLESLQNI